MSTSFGLACAPWVFTKTLGLKPVAAQLRQLGVRLIVYTVINRIQHMIQFNIRN
jgi:hypothetical protein